MRKLATNVMTAGKIIAVAAMIFTTPALAGSSPWLDRDNASGKGDYETTRDLLKIQCKIRGTKQKVSTGIPSAGYYKDPVQGCWCINAKVPGNNRCKDIVIKYRW